MKCPYCLSSLEKGALVCKSCSRDLYLFGSILEKIDALSDRLDNLVGRELVGREAIENKVTSLENSIKELKSWPDFDECKKKNYKKDAPRTIIQKINFRVVESSFLILTIVFLVVGHALIVVIYDLPLIWLRIISIIIPLVAAFLVFSRQRLSVFTWTGASVLAAIFAVLGMSSVNALVDGTPIFPSSVVEWREFIEYSVSIVLGFISGVLFGSLVYVGRHKMKVSSPLVSAIIVRLRGKKLSGDAIQRAVNNVNQLGATLLALGTTLMSIYAGLKSVL